MIRLITFIVGLAVTLALSLLPWLFGFFGGFWYGRAKGRQEMLGQRDEMEKLANRQFDRFLDERERALAANGRAERAEFELRKRTKKVTPLGENEWPEVIGDSDDDDVPTIG